MNRQLVADVPVGSILSGGMDSGSITAIASQQLDRMCTFTGGFDFTRPRAWSGLRRATEAEAMSYRCRTEHYEMVLKAGDMER